MVTAILSLQDVRDPAAVGGWLRSVVRNNCRTRLRAKRPSPVADPEWFLSADEAFGAQELIERAVGGKRPGDGGESAVAALRPGAWRGNRLGTT
ncbi:hypothetical protein [Streptomyces sp. NPDC093260]|uniref:hypothetical protein n=1 Tax=Streptomyces sp. NPDC093260 TaxID=3155073 RepID=UPI0034425F79